KGDLVSKNLYSETMGGPHLHFEIRFYRNSEIGNEDFYNWQNSGNYTTQSSGIWSYGYWNPDVGYGFGNPLNFGIE
ncbi:MAG: murein DD-endopeptidase MepM/ murein hydrolase activator NlpD, partial [Saprospiraceae bacterium]